MKRILSVLLLVASIGGAYAQSVQQSGPSTNNTSPIWGGTGIIKGGNSATDSPLTTFGVTRDAADGICVSSDRASAAGRNQLCLQAATSGPAKISLQNYGTATAQNLQFVLNGTSLTLPSGGGTFLTGTGAFAVGHAVCVNNTSGVLQDCGGTAWGVPYFSSTAALLSTTALTDGQMVVGQTGGAPTPRTLTGDVSSVSSTGAVTLGSVNSIPFASSYTAHGVLLAQGSSTFTSTTTSNTGYCLLSQGLSADPIWAACASGAGSAGGANTQVQFNSSTSLAGSPNMTWVSPALSLGAAGGVTGQLVMNSAAGAGVTVQSPTTVVAYNFNLPTTAGSTGQPLVSGGGGATAMSFGTLGIGGGGTNCTGASGTCLDNITGFSSTGYINRTGAGTYAFSTIIPVSGGGTALASGTSGGILGYTGSGTLASSAALTANALVLGGGAGATPTPMASLGTTTTVLHGNAAGAPTFGAVSLTADVSGILPLANGGTNANLTAALGAIPYSTASAIALLAPTATAALPLLSGASAAPTWATVSHPTSASSGGVAYFSSGTVMASSSVLTANGVMLGGGIGGSPSTTVAGTSAQVLLGQTGVAPTWNTVSGNATISASGVVTIGASQVANSMLANAAVYTLKGNFTGSPAAPQDSTIAALTLKASPAASDELLLADNAASGALKRASVSSIASAGSVASIAGNTGSFTLAGGVTNTANQIQFDGRYASLNTGHNCAIAASVATNLLTVTLTDAGGSALSATSPCYINYRSATAGTGTTTLVAQTSAISISTGSTGVTLGSANNSAFRFWVVAFNNSGTNVLALYNASSPTRIYPLDETGVASALGIGAGAVNAGVFYAQGGAITAKAFRIIGYVEYNSTGLATAGTYATAPSFVQVFGPGVKKPGDRVQLVSFTSSTTSSFTSSSYAATSVSSTITPVSAANLISVRAGGSARPTGAGTAGQLVLRRNGSTDLASAYFAGVLNLRVSTYMEGLDFPNSTSSQTYAVYMASSDNVTAVNYPESPATPWAPLFMEEIQG